MSKIGEVLATATLSFAPSQVMWSRDGQSLAALGPHPMSVGFGSQMLGVLDAATGERRWSKDTVDTRSVAISSDAGQVAVAGGLGRVEPIYVPFLDCSDLPPQDLEECERFNREEAGTISGYEVPPDRVSVLAAPSGSVRWWREDPDAAARHVGFSPDEKLLAVTGQGTLLLDADNGDVRLELGSVSSPLLPAAFSRDSRSLAVADSIRMVLVDVTAGATRWVISLPEAVSQFAFTENDTALVVVTERQVLTLSADTGDTWASVPLEVPILGSHPTVLSADGRRLVRVGPESMALWNVADGGRRFETPVQSPATVRFNPVLPEIAIVSAGGVRVLNSKLGATVWEHGTDPVKSLAFSPDGRRLALCGAARHGSGFVHVHDMNPTSVSHYVCEGPVAKIALTSSLGRLAVAASHDPDAKSTVFHSDTGDLVLEKVQPGSIICLSFSPDGRHFATGGTDGGVRLYTALTGNREWMVAHTAKVNGVAFLSGDGEDGVVTVGQDKTVRRLARATGDADWQVSHPQPVTLVAVSPDGRWIATACMDRSTRILNPATGAELFSFSHDGRIRAIAFDPQGSRLATGGDDGAVLIIDTATGRELGRSLHTREVTAIAFSHDGALLATAGKDHAVNLFDLTVAPPGLVRGLAFPQTITKLVFHPTEAELALVNDEPTPTVTIIDTTKEGTELTRLTHPATVNDLAYSPDGKLLATACADSLARVYPGRRES
ncbi:WD40 repeat domain-containing protein [Streptomyces purpureus]|uniref:Uncharacterized protein n=1 Tax=Streptomyces purpureus TaxID=1951 RepID=A0A918GZW1_9ACTN|nr:WD40 repeat domain-containing protein [Streptomyces purpureus]GGT29030.1 hypothetical protein GCM10014713_23090 [Streptomyces purpureus]